jgi:hypothetical protein
LDPHRFANSLPWSGVDRYLLNGKGDEGQDVPEAATQNQLSGSQPITSERIRSDVTAYSKRSLDWGGDGPARIECRANGAFELTLVARVPRSSGATILIHCAHEWSSHLF